MKKLIPKVRKALESESEPEEEEEEVKAPPKTKLKVKGPKQVKLEDTPAMKRTARSKSKPKDANMKDEG